MATRAQVFVSGGIGATDGEKEEIALYHHCDGYPTNIVEIIEDAFFKYSRKKAGHWKLGRVGKVASMLCSIDPLGFDVEIGTPVHGDLDWFYQLDVYWDNGPRWDLKCFCMTYGKKLCGIVPISGRYDRIDASYIEKEGAKNANS